MLQQACVCRLLLVLCGCCSAFRLTMCCCGCPAADRCVLADALHACIYCITWGKGALLLPLLLLLLLLLLTFGNTQPPPLDVISRTSVVSGVGAAPGYLMGMHLHTHANTPPSRSRHQPCAEPEGHHHVML